MQKKIQLFVSLELSLLFFLLALSFDSSEGFFWSDIGIAPLDKGIYKTVPIRRVLTITFIGYKESLLQQLDEWKANLDAQIQKNLFESDSDEELLMDILLPQLEELANEVDERKQWGESTLGRLHGVKRDCIEGHEQIMADYFTETPVYDKRFFRRRFRMRRLLFLRILAAVVAFDDYFLQKPNAAGLMGLLSIQKCIAALRMFEYRIAADATNEYVRLGANTAMLSMKRFCAAIRGCFQSTYLRSPTREDLEKKMAINSDRGFLGMFGSIDCMYWDWKNCPVSWQRQYEDKDDNKSIILEAIAD